MGRVDLRATIRSITQGAVKTPLGLASITKFQAIALDQSALAEGAVALLWQCAKCQFDYPVGRVTKRFHNDPDATPRLIDRIAGKTIEQPPA